MKSHKLCGLLSIKIAYIRSIIEINTSTVLLVSLDNKVCRFQFAILFSLC